MRAPEPCLSVGRGGCHSPVACNGWGYCRERNFVEGVPSEETQRNWRKLAEERRIHSHGRKG